MNPTLIIARREFRSYFDSPLAYVVVCLSLLILGVWIFAGPRNFWQIDQATLRAMFEAMPLGLVLLIVPVVTMRLVAEEKRTGTLEMLITLPVKDSEVILGKYLGALGLVMVLVASTLLYPVLMFKFPWHLGALDMGPVFTGYVGISLLAAAAVAVGLLISTLTESQVIAFFVTFIVLIGLLQIAEFAQYVPDTLGSVLRLLSFQEHYTGFERGVIDVADVAYFVSCAALALLLAFRALESRKWA